MREEETADMSEGLLQKTNKFFAFVSPKIREIDVYITIFSAFLILLLNWKVFLPYFNGSFEISYAQDVGIFFLLVYAFVSLIAILTTVNVFTKRIASRIEAAIMVQLSAGLTSCSSFLMLVIIWQDFTSGIAMGLLNALIASVGLLRMASMVAFMGKYGKWTQFEFKNTPFSHAALATVALIAIAIGGDLLGINPVVTYISMLEIGRFFPQENEPRPKQDKNYKTK